ncbi:uncharacterized protein LOC108905198 [Anoplophora glabripennis]|uniref:uncharacterized protein LOC108905198 n=1 Tax=Anoplophora glabripennis TaxID=217634 RepID=UPI000873EF7C|nr:uncharacterized protein LOC108905198 [Anoplophora glabripennis]
MNIDTELMFECLIHLNMFYYPVFATCESIMTAAKYNSIINTPDILRDGAVVFTKLIAELVKILLFRRFKEERRKLITAATLLLTFVTIAALFYSFFIQYPVLKLEMILNSLTTLLAFAEILFGILDILPCCLKRHYY